MRLRAALILACAALAGGLSAGSTGAVNLTVGPTNPSLVVVLVVDQMRADYVDRYGHQWIGGLRHMLDDGARFTEAAYPYLNTVTCPGHATISTGRFPLHHGMILNEWWDRQAGRQRSCTEDPAANTLTAAGQPAGAGHSSVSLLGPTLADAIAERNGRVVSVSLKPRSAVMMAGHHGDLVAWFDDSDAVATSSAYSPRFPPFLSAFLESRPVEADLGKTWAKVLPGVRYRGLDDAAGERPPAGWRRTFPHAIDGTRSARAYGQWETSPFADDFLAELAMEAVNRLKLGRGDAVDFLGISFSVLDRAGHAFGPDSHEVQDVLVRLDRTIGRLLAHLDRQVGQGRYTVALSADHGVAPIPERAMADGLDAGRISTQQVADSVNAVLVSALGPGGHVARMNYTDLYLAPGVWQRIASRPDTVRSALDAMTSQPGVLRAFRGDELARATADADPVKRAAALSYYAPRSGDLIMVPKPYWLTASAATTHGTLHPYDRRVPLVIYGAGIRPGVYRQAASPADVAPTLAHLAGVALKETDGQPLTPALARAPTVTAKPHDP